MGYYFKGHESKVLKTLTCRVSYDFKEVYRDKIEGRLETQCVKVPVKVAKRLLAIQIANGYVRLFTDAEIIAEEKSKCNIGYDDEDGYTSMCTCGHHH